MAYASSHNTTFNMKGDFIPTQSKRKMIEFRLHLKVNTWNWIQHSNSHSIKRIDPTSNDYYSSATTTFVDHLPKYDDMKCVVERAAGNREYGLDCHEIRIMIGQALEEVIWFMDTEMQTCGIMRIVCTAEMRRYCIVEFENTPRRQLPAAENDGDVGSCCICLEEMATGKSVRMQCLHFFHDDCIKKWLRSRHYCPLCRRPISDYR